MQAAVLIHLHTKAPTRKATKKLSIPLSTHMEGPTSPQIYYPSPFSHKPASPGNGVRNLWPNLPINFQCLKFSTHTPTIWERFLFLSILLHPLAAMSFTWQLTCVMIDLLSNLLLAAPSPWQAARQPWKRNPMYLFLIANPILRALPVSRHLPWRNDEIRAELYFEEQEPGSHNCQVQAINNVYGDCLLTNSMLHNFIRNKALEDPERATGWKATYNENQGFSDDAVDAWLSTQKNLSLQKVYKVPNQCPNLDNVLNNLTATHSCNSFLCRGQNHSFAITPSQNTKTPGNF